MLVWLLQQACRACTRYTAGVYSLLPGGLGALPSFKDIDCKVPADAMMNDPALRMGGCFRVSRAPEPEPSSDSDSDSPRHADAAVRAQPQPTLAHGKKH